jgi:hypothetical protein
MPDHHRDLLERATEAIKGIDATLARHEAAFSRHEAAFSRHERNMEILFRRMDERDELAAERHEALMREHRRLLDRFARSEDRVVDALGDLQNEATRNTSRLDDMGEAIRANTRAVLSVLDRLGPAPG